MKERKFNYNLPFGGNFNFIKQKPFELETLIKATFNFIVFDLLLI